MNDVSARGIGGAALVLALLVCLPADADRLHLDSGGVIETTRWWIDGDWLHYESPAGTVGVPRGVVVRIESATVRSTEPAPPSTSGAGFIAPPRVKRNPEATRLSLAERQQVADLMAQVRDALEARDFEAAGFACREILGLEPQHTTAKVGYAISEMSLGRDAVALSIVLDGLAQTPDQPELLELLGDLRNREEKLEDALRAWKQAFERSPNDRLREKIFQAERELKAGGNFDITATSHFTLRYDGDVDRGLAAEVMDYLEHEYWELADRFRHAPPQPITVQLFATRAFREVTQAPEWVGGLYDGKIRVPLGGLDRLTVRAKSVLVHEMTHAVVHSKTRGRCPRWLHEGLAQWSEGKTVGPAESAQVRKLLIDHGPAKWDAGGFSYAAALSLTEFLEARRGVNGLVWLLDAMGDGKTIDGALMQTYGMDYAGLCRRWGSETLEQRRR